MQLKVQFKMFKSLKVKTDKNTQAFFALLKAGLWESFPVHGEGLKVLGQAKRQSRANGSSGVDWEKVHQLAEEQSVLGLVLAGIERYKKLNIDLHLNQELLLQWIGEVQMLEQQNKDMNAFIEKLIERMRNAGIYALLLKGQGVAQCYERPLWRTSGDVDLFLSDINYKNAKSFLTPLAIQIEKENGYTKHIGMTIDQWEVELHGAMRGELWQSIDNVLDGVQYDIFCGGNVRSWLNGKTQVFIPRADEDVVYVFTHILQHFYMGGIGLRQVCDWCRLLWKFKDKLDFGLLESRIRKAGVMTEWKAFAALAVEYLGMPAEAMAFYDASNKWQKKAQKVLNLVLETGNFGHNRDMSFRNEGSAIKRKTQTFRLITSDSFRQFFIFPIDTVKVWFIMMGMGVRALFKKN